MFFHSVVLVQYANFNFLKISKLYDHFLFSSLRVFDLGVSGVVLRGPFLKGGLPVCRYVKSRRVMPFFSPSRSAFDFQITTAQLCELGTRSKLNSKLREFQTNNDKIIPLFKYEYVRFETAQRVF